MNAHITFVFVLFATRSFSHRHLVHFSVSKPAPLLMTPLLRGLLLYFGVKVLNTRFLAFWSDSLVTIRLVTIRACVHLDSVLFEAMQAIILLQTVSHFQRMCLHLAPGGVRTVITVFVMIIDLLFERVQ